MPFLLVSSVKAPNGKLCLCLLYIYCFLFLLHIFGVVLLTCLMFCFSLISIMFTPVCYVLSMYNMLVDCVLASLCGQNPTSCFTADESWDSETQVEHVHGACWKRPREAGFSLGRRCHSYYDVPAWVCVQWFFLMDVTYTFTAVNCSKYVRNRLKLACLTCWCHKILRWCDYLCLCGSNVYITFEVVTYDTVEDSVSTVVSVSDAVINVL